MRTNLEEIVEDKAGLITKRDTEVGPECTDMPSFWKMLSNVLKMLVPAFFGFFFCMFLEFIN
jgi:hypothetical protein